MKIAVISANLGSFEKPTHHVEQSTPADYFLFNDENFPPRFNAMTPRLQARLVKMFMYQMKPGYNYYLWIDSSCILSHKDSIQWFMEHLGDNDIAVLKHPTRNTIGEEAEYIKERLALEKAGEKAKYILPRYENELIDEQMAEINDASLPLYASTAFIYRNSYDIQNMMKEWWYGTSRYHIVDQIWLPHAIKQTRRHVSVIQDNFMKCDYIKPVRV